ncbi:uncharacterized protein LOC110430190 isoform X1 [Sorghum bicolor]|uniref:K-box domain-containing protein n=3 Tax=Sorghum bicolor TaxID=4558 RepID=A0A1Z5R277_SORBI|nr:uncharacterized protein LOC110430190 isoform X1 [Sorghum bicolor]OQU77531.1 hypothetical protein SORBI_3009G062701 [Sorghum bicolor]|eukprot:XP_021303030.1 uncharacterized protein LOC110430190 isoform X1 [Sorghum bicolor]
MPTSPLCAPHLTSMLRGAEAQRKAFSDGKLLQFCCSKEKRSVSCIVMSIVVPQPSAVENLEISLKHIPSRKNKTLPDQLFDLKSKEQELHDPNKDLRKKDSLTIRAMILRCRSWMRWKPSPP